jgi:hypothetical protein
VLSSECRFEIREYASVNDAEREAGLRPGRVDHGGVRRGVLRMAVIVDEFSMFAPPEDTFYAAIGKQLIAGNAVLYAFDELGATRDLSDPPAVAFYGRGRERVERAIAAGAVMRPEVRVNGRLLWRWPDPAPAELRR